MLTLVTRQGKRIGAVRWRPRPRGDRRDAAFLDIYFYAREAIAEDADTASAEGVRVTAIGWDAIVYGASLVSIIIFLPQGPLGLLLPSLAMAPVRAI